MWGEKVNILVCDAELLKSQHLDRPTGPKFSR